jgi:hypothetical protein
MDITDGFAEKLCQWKECLTKYFSCVNSVMYVVAGNNFFSPKMLGVWVWAQWSRFDTTIRIWDSIPKTS